MATRTLASQASELSSELQSMTTPLLTLSDASARVPATPSSYRLAICVTGLERRYSEISTNIEEAIFRMTQRPYLFGVKPDGLWPNVNLRFEAVEVQRPLCWPSSRLPFNYYPVSATPGFLREICDLDHCEQMIAAYEQRVLGSQFELVPGPFEPHMRLTVPTGCADSPSRRLTGFTPAPRPVLGTTAAPAAGALPSRRCVRAVDVPLQRALR